MMTYYHFFLVCPRCKKNSETFSDRRPNPNVSCGDCLMDDVEIVPMKVVKVDEVVR